MIMIKAFVFDVDNTLYSFDAAHKIAFQSLSDYANRAFGLSTAQFADLHHTGDLLLREHLGSECAAVHNRLIRYQLMLEQIGQPLSHAPVMASLYWSTLLEAMSPMPGAVECFRRLKDSGFTIGIGTNMTADYQYAKLQRLGLLDLVDFIVTSEEVGAEKPDRKLFDYCVKKAGCLAHECAFVGDSFPHDVLGAEAAGLKPVWLHADASDADCVQIVSLAELPGPLL